MSFWYLDCGVFSASGWKRFAARVSAAPRLYARVAAPSCDAGQNSGRGDYSDSILRCVEMNGLDGAQVRAWRGERVARREEGLANVARTRSNAERAEQSLHSEGRNPPPPPPPPQAARVEFTLCCAPRSHTSSSSLPQPHPLPPTPPIVLRADVFYDARVLATVLRTGSGLRLPLVGLLGGVRPLVRRRRRRRRRRRAPPCSTTSPGHPGTFFWSPAPPRDCLSLSFSLLGYFPSS